MAEKDDKDSKKPAAADVDDDDWGEDEDAPDSDAPDSEDEPADKEADESEADDSEAEDDDDDDAEDEDAEDEARAASAPPASKAPASKAPASKASAGKGKGAVTRAASRAAEAHDHGLAHVTPVKLLLGVFGALTVLTVATVAVTSVDLGSQGNFIIAMIIATIKAGLVMAFFMHLVWDKKFNLTVFLSSFLFVLLFLSLALTDRNEYQLEIDDYEVANPVTTQSKAATGSAAPAP